MTDAPKTPIRALIEAVEAKLRVPAESLSVLLSYDETSGKLFWKDRPSELFKSERDAKACNARYSGREAFATTVKGYKAGTLFDKHCYAHRAIIAMVNMEWPDEVDHVNGDKQDNRISNLRAVIHADNMRNYPLPSSNTSGEIGVHWSNSKGAWVASIGIDSKIVFIGHYSNYRDAVIARRAASKVASFHENHGRKAYEAQQ